MEPGSLKLCRKKATNWSLPGNIQFVSSVLCVLAKSYALLLSNRRIIRLKQENLSCTNKTNYTRRHKFITHKNNCGHVFSKSRYDQPMFVNENKVGWQSSSLKKKVFWISPSKTKTSFLESKRYSSSYEHVSILTLGEPLFLLSFH